MRSPDVEQLLRVDAGHGPAVPIGDAEADAIVGGALDAVYPVPGGGGAGGGVGIKIAAVVAALAAAGAGAWFALREPDPQTFAITFASPTEPTITVAAVEPEAPIPEIEITVPIEIDKKPEPVRELPPKVEDLMAEANAARKAKEWKKAEGLYSRVVDEYRGTSAAQVALVASATLRLEHLGDARGAVKRFKQAAGGPLAEEARYGLAEAYRAMGDDVKEAEALTDFLRHHGDSPLADRARKRRTQLP